MSVGTAKRSVDSHPFASGSPARGRLALLYPYDWWDTFQPLLDAASLLAEDGWLVDVIVPSRPVALPQSPPGVTFVCDHPELFPAAGIRPVRFAERHGGRMHRALVASVIRPGRRLLGCSRRWLVASEGECPYVCFIGFDGEGLSAAAHLGRYSQRPHIFWSLEQSFRDECETRAERRRKNAEAAASRSAAIVITQDHWRAEMLSEENGLRGTRLVLVPVACRGRAHSRASDFVHRELGLASRVRVVVCPGHLAEWAETKQLAKASRALPNGCVLVLHARQRLTEAGVAEWRRVIHELSAGRALLSHRGLDRTELLSMLDSASVGVALYDAARPESPERSSRNVEVMGYSSGKVSDFLQCSLPVIASDTLGPRNLVTEWGCGSVIQSPAALSTAVAQILDDRPRYSAAAAGCFNAVLELERHFDEVMRLLRPFGR
jgi:glycosyltransferase involved in cell wall biosynthesis